jgi:hypothetical protein
VTHDEIRRVLEVVYPEQRDRAPFAATMLRRLIDGVPIGRLLAEAVRTDTPPALAADETALPETLRTGRLGRPHEKT